MSALSKLAVGQDAGTSRPATPKYADAPPLKPNSHGKHSLGTLQPDGWSSPVPFSAVNKRNPKSSSGETGFSSNQSTLNGCRNKHSTACEPSKDLPVQELLQRTGQLKLCIKSGFFVSAKQHSKQQVDSTSQAANGVHTAASVAAGQSQRLSRPVTPHATKPYRSMPACLIAQQQCSTSIKHVPRAARVHILAAHQPAGRASICTGRCHIQPSDSRPASADAWQTEVHRHTFSEELGTVAGASPKKPQQLEPRPGSAAAARLLRAMDRACKLKPTRRTSGASSHSCGDDLSRMQQQQPLKSSRACRQLLNHLVQLSSCTDGSEDASVHKLISAPLASESCNGAAAAAAAAPAPSSTLDTDECLPAQLAHEPSVQCHHQARLGAHAAALQGDASVGLHTRPTTAALQSVLAAAACPGDGVDDHLAAIRSRNNALDGTPGLDILQGYGGEEHELVYEDVCGGLHDAAAPQAAGVWLGQQAAPMVLNLEDMAQSTAEVLELELESLDVQQLQALSAALGGV